MRLEAALSNTILFDKDLSLDPKELHNMCWEQIKETLIDPYVTSIAFDSWQGKRPLEHNVFDSNHFKQMTKVNFPNAGMEKYCKYRQFMERWKHNTVTAGYFDQNFDRDIGHAMLRAYKPGNNRIVTSSIIPRTSIQVGAECYRTYVLEERSSASWKLELERDLHWNLASAILCIAHSYSEYMYPHMRGWHSSNPPWSSMGYYGLSKSIRLDKEAVFPFEDPRFPVNRWSTEDPWSTESVTFTNIDLWFESVVMTLIRVDDQKVIPNFDLPISTDTGEYIVPSVHRFNRWVNGDFGDDPSFECTCVLEELYAAVWECFTYVTLPDPSWIRATISNGDSDLRTIIVTIPFERDGEERVKYAGPTNWSHTCIFDYSLPYGSAKDLYSPAALRASVCDIDRGPADDAAEHLSKLLLQDEVLNIVHSRSMKELEDLGLYLETDTARHSHVNVCLVLTVSASPTPEADFQHCRVTSSMRNVPGSHVMSTTCSSGLSPKEYWQIAGPDNQWSTTYPMIPALNLFSRIGRLEFVNANIKPTHAGKGLYPERVLVERLATLSVSSLRTGDPRLDETIKEFQTYRTLIFRARTPGINPESTGAGRLLALEKISPKNRTYGF